MSVLWCAGSCSCHGHVLLGHWRGGRRLALAFVLHKTCPCNIWPECLLQNTTQSSNTTHCCTNKDSKTQHGNVFLPAKEIEDDDANMRIIGNGCGSCLPRPHTAPNAVLCCTSTPPQGMPDACKALPQRRLSSIPANFDAFFSQFHNVRQKGCKLCSNKPE